MALGGPEPALEAGERRRRGGLAHVVEPRAGPARILDREPVQQLVRAGLPHELPVHRPPPVRRVRTVAQHDDRGGGLALPPGHVHAARRTEVAGDELELAAGVAPRGAPAREPGGLVLLGRPAVHGRRYSPSNTGISRPVASTSTSSPARSARRQWPRTPLLKRADHTSSKLPSSTDCAISGVVAADDLTAARHASARAGSGWTLVRSAWTWSRSARTAATSSPPTPGPISPPVPQAAGGEASTRGRRRASGSTRRRPSAAS